MKEIPRGDFMLFCLAEFFRLMPADNFCLRNNFIYCLARLDLLTKLCRKYQERIFLLVYPDDVRRRFEKNLPHAKHFQWK